MELNILYLIKYIILGIPILKSIYLWLKIKEINKRLDTFENNNHLAYDANNIIWICVCDSNMSKKFEKILFNKYQKIVIVQSDDISINGIKLPKAKCTFEIISDTRIEINFINNQNKLESATIRKGNNLKQDPTNREKFEQITNWRD